MQAARRGRSAAADLAMLAAALAAACAAGCGRAGGPSDEVPVRLTAAASAAQQPAAAQDPPAPLEPALDDPVGRLEVWRKAGQFDAFVEGALQAATEEPDRAKLQALKAEAQLAIGALVDAEQSAERAASLALAQGDDALAVMALRLWVTARLRQGQPLSSETIAPLVSQLPENDPAAQVVRYWGKTLSDRVPYTLAGGDAGEPVEIPLTKAAVGTIWADLNTIEARANGVALPMVFVDTGTQHTIMTRRAAENAGLRLGANGTALVGFVGLAAQPAVLDALELGELTLFNVPVLVGDSPALVAAKGQMALGTELMHHVRFTLDYPGRRVLADRAARPPAAHDTDPRWEIPLWTFSQACLARAETARGTARVLVDTGNRSGAYLSARWAQRHLPQFQRPGSAMIFKFRQQGFVLDTMELGNCPLVNWPILDRIPRDLERLDIVDVLVGRDLLWPYRLSIDMHRRVLRLDGGPESPIPAADALP
jgi:hypothetical protein